MPSHAQLIRSFFKTLGLEPELVALYLALHEHGPQTISELSRSSGVERTRIYRLTGALKQSQLFEIETHYKRDIYRAAPITNLRLLVSHKDQQLRNLQAALPAIEVALTPHTFSSPSSRVQFYSGEEGAKQMLWNETKATTPLLGILYENIQTRTRGAFFERWVRACNERGLQFRGIIGDEFIRSQQQWYGKRTNERLAHWEPRYVSHDVFPIHDSVIVYDDVVAHYNWKDGEIFGIEIHNAEIALTQRQFFELLWRQGAAIDDLTGKKTEGE